jgi:hypothetical protein
MDFGNIYMDWVLLKYKNKIKVWLKFESPVHIYVMRL